VAQREISEPLADRWRELESVFRRGWNAVQVQGGSATTSRRSR